MTVMWRQGPCPGGRVGAALSSVPCRSTPARGGGLQAREDCIGMTSTAPTSNGLGLGPPPLRTTEVLARRDGTSQRLCADTLALAFRPGAGAGIRPATSPAWGRRWMGSDGCAGRADDTLHLFRRRGALRLPQGGAGRGASDEAQTPHAEIPPQERLRRRCVRRRMGRAAGYSRLPGTAAQWDCRPGLLNTPGARLDLRTGRAAPAPARGYPARTPAVAPAADCPLFRAPSSASSRSGTRRLVLPSCSARSLTRINRQMPSMALFFCSGTAENGKEGMRSTTCSAASATIGRVRRGHIGPPPPTGERHPADPRCCGRGRTHGWAVQGGGARPPLERGDGIKRTLSGGERVPPPLRAPPCAATSSPTAELQLFITGTPQAGLPASTRRIRRRFQFCAVRPSRSPSPDSGLPQARGRVARILPG